MSDLSTADMIESLRNAGCMASDDGILNCRPIADRLEKIQEENAALQSRIDGMLSDEAVDRAIDAQDERWISLTASNHDLSTVKRQSMRAAIKAAMGDVTK